MNPPTYAPAFALFSGGHDSLCATHYAMTRGYADEVVHINTGIGIPATREFVLETCRKYGWPLNELHPPESYEELVLERGFPGPAMHYIFYTRLKERCLAAFARERKEKRGDPIVFCSGVRKAESSRRMRGQQSEWLREGRLGWWWRAVILDWSKADCNRYIEANLLPRNPVVDKIHMSGECKCGAFARPGEREEDRFWFPEFAARLDELETKVEAAGHHGCIWGVRPPRVHRDQGALFSRLGMLCSSCEWREEEVDEKGAQSWAV